MKLKVIETTDGQHLGIEFELPTPILTDVVLPIAEGVNFRIDKTIDNGDGTYTYCNPHYVGVAREV